jgi:hypothetical protein
VPVVSACIIDGPMAMLSVPAKVPLNGNGPAPTLSLLSQ